MLVKKKIKELEIGKKFKLPSWSEVLTKCNNLDLDKTYTINERNTVSWLFNDTKVVPVE